MPHAIYGPANHTLDRVELAIGIPTARNRFRTSVTAHGRSETKRGFLWSLNEAWERDEAANGLQVADQIHLLSLVVLQDHPASQEVLEAVLRGSGHEQSPLF